MFYALDLANYVFLLASLGALWMMGLPVTWTVLQHLRCRRKGMLAEARLLETPLPPDPALPRVLIQIPTFNEGSLVRGIAKAVASMDWPSDRLRVQFLDDSTDGSVLAVGEAVSSLRQKGIDAEVLHRDHRAGFKAGALAQGLTRAREEFVAIFDADYLPPSQFLRSCMRPMLGDPWLAFVQARCDYRNPNQNWLTRIQQRILDAHFGIEQAVRSWTGQVLPFNGTCGIWRRAAIDDAGGWQGDTLAEDLDLSYRAQLRGWRAVFLVGVAVPGELPHDFGSWRRQQFRWTKGPAQVARKLLPAVWRSSISVPQKLLSTLTFCGSAFGPLLGIASTAAAIVVVFGTGFSPMLAVVFGVANLQAICAASVMLLLGQQSIRGAKVWREVGWIPVTVGLFCLLSFANLQAALEALLGRTSAFVRTPKVASPG